MKAGSHCTLSTQNERGALQKSLNERESDVLYKRGMKKV